jgi:hypothetical protein
VELKRAPAQATPNRKASTGIRLEPARQLAPSSYSVCPSLYQASIWKSVPWFVYIPLAQLVEPKAWKQEPNPEEDGCNCQEYL